jgi:HD-like signal output (HDOD) protein
VGSLLTLATLRPELAKQWEARHGQGWPGGAAEAAHFGGDHAAVGGYLLSLWGLSENLAKAVAWHHAAEKDPQDLVLKALHQAVEESRTPIAA